jgi:hypothetical protein
MSYTTAKAAFEGVVKSLQNSLQKYVGGGVASQRAVDIQTENINKLVEYYAQAEAQINALQAEKDNMSLQYNKLHSDAGKLVLFCQLHGINPNLIFYYSQEELTKMHNQGIKITLPAIAYDDIVFSMNNEQIITDIKSPENDTHPQYAPKYHFLTQFCRK